MTPEMRQQIAKELRENTDMTKEQYIQTCLLCEELDLAIDTPEEQASEQQEWKDLLGE